MYSYLFTTADVEVDAAAGTLVTEVSRLEDPPPVDQTKNNKDDYQTDYHGSPGELTELVLTTASCMEGKP